MGTHKQKPKLTKEIEHWTKAMNARCMRMNPMFQADLPLNSNPHKYIYSPLFLSYLTESYKT